MPVEIISRRKISPATIVFYEGAEHIVTIPITGFVPLTNYNASIQFRNLQGALMMTFTTTDGTLVISEQSIIMNILPANSIGKSGKGNWQLKIWTSSLDVAKFDTCDYIIEKATIL